MARMMVSVRKLVKLKSLAEESEMGKHSWLVHEKGKCIVNLGGGIKNPHSYEGGERGKMSIKGRLIGDPD